MHYKKIFDSIHKEGYIPIGILIISTCISFAIYWSLGAFLLFLTAGCAFFFRDPIRVIPVDEDLILSPADGLVYNVNHDNEDDTRISIFLSVMSVHVNRIPVSGIVEKLTYAPGKFIRASSHKDSEDNERQDITIRTKSNVVIKFSQIAGFIARRIICNLQEGEEVSSGAKFGIIKFGSRVDLFIPKNIDILISEGQTLIGGETIIANLSKDHQAYKYITG